MTTYRIYTADISTLESKIERLARKAVKLNCAPIALNVLRKYQEVNDFIVYEFAEVEITGEAPCINGWTLISRLDHTDGLIYNAPGQSTPAKYRDVKAECEHCHLDRMRNSTFIIEKDGDYKQIGGNCLADFLGGRDPHQYGEIFEMYTCMDKLIGELAEGDGGRDEDDYYGARGVAGYDLTRFLAWVSFMINRDGWVSRTKAKEDYTGRTRATVDCALYVMQDKYNKEKPAPEDVETAEEVVAWMNSLAGREGLSDYLYNLATIAQNKSVADKSAGYAGSAIVAMRNEQEQARAALDAAKSLSYVGEPGKRLTLTLTVEAVQVIGGMYTSYLHKFVDDKGNKITWFSSNETLQIGQRYTGKATVKSHDLFRGIPQTVITRAKLAEVAS